LVRTRFRTRLRLWRLRYDRTDAGRRLSLLPGNGGSDSGLLRAEEAQKAKEEKVTEEITPPPVFPQYEPPNPAGIAIMDPRQAKPLMKMIKQRLHPRPKARVSPVKKRLAKPRKDRQG